MAARGPDLLGPMVKGVGHDISMGSQQGRCFRHIIKSDQEWVSRKLRSDACAQT